MYNEINKLLRDKDSQISFKKKLHTESSYTLINSLSLTKWHVFKVVYALSAKWMQQLKNLFIYNEKSIHKHTEFICNAVTTFHLIFKNFFNNYNKILFVMQFLAEESWDA